MYESFYGFRERPFTLLPDPDFLFLDEKHRTALAMLEKAVSARSGFCVISGEIGAGKTTLIRELLNRLDDTVCVGLVSNTHPSFGELLQWIMAAYGLPCGDGDEPELHKRFIEFAIQQHAQNKHTLLIIDEAQNLTTQALEELRVLSSINSERDLVLQVILVGQQQLRDRLQQPELEQFSQRIAHSYHLQALNPDETSRYIQHRVTHAGGTAGLFNTDACQAVYKLSGGIPRLINRLCDLSLVYGCTAGNKLITAELVDRVAEDQRMGTLKDIPRVDSVAAEPEQSAELSAAAPDAGESPGQAEEGDRQPTDTIVGAASPGLIPETGTAVSQQETATETVVSSELHQLVVDAEHKKRTRGERGALWLLLAVVVMAGGTGWLMRDFGDADPVAEASDTKQQVVSPATSQPPAAAEDPSTVPVTAESSRVDPPEASVAQQQDNDHDRQPAVADHTDPVTKDAGQDSATEHVSVQNEKKAEKTAAAEAAQQRAAELRHEAEKTARLKKESERMEREQRAAEQRLARQRAARKEFERRARLEEKKMIAAREAAKKLADERTRAEKRLAEAAAEKPVRQAPARADKAVAGFPEATVDAYDEDDGDAIIQDAKASLVSGNEVVVETESADSVQDPPGASSTTGEEAKDEKVEFAANPCHGPTARFLSTCR